MGILEYGRITCLALVYGYDTDGAEVDMIGLLSLGVLVVGVILLVNRLGKFDIEDDFDERERL